MRDFTPEQLCFHAIGGLGVCADFEGGALSRVACADDWGCLYLRVHSSISAPNQK